MTTTPYYADDLTTLYHGRWEDVLPSLGERFGVVVTSPPYNLNGDGHSTGGSGKVWTALADGYADHDDAMPHAEYVAWQQRLLTACWEHLTDDGAIFYNHKPRAIGGSMMCGAYRS